MRGDGIFFVCGRGAGISIHSPRMRGDVMLVPEEMQDRYNFNPLPSHEGRRYGVELSKAAMEISIHSPRMRGDTMGALIGIDPVISIHSPRMRGDACVGHAPRFCV